MKTRRAHQRSLWLAVLFAVPMATTLATNPASFARTIFPEGMRDPAVDTYGKTDPVARSFSATTQLQNDFLDAQHRFQADSNRRQLRGRRPEPGEVEVTREEKLIAPRDPLSRTLRSILPRER